VYVVRDAANGQYIAAQLLRLALDAAISRPQNLANEPWVPFFGGPDQVEIDLDLAPPHRLRSFIVRRTLGRQARQRRI
jgi:hypothetical protein